MKTQARVLMLLLVYVVVFTTVIAPGSNANAAVRVVEDGSTEFSQGNKLVLHREPNITNFKVTSNIASSRLIDQTNNPAAHFKKYHNFQQHYDNVWYEIKNPKKADRITANYGNAGTYEGRAVDLQVDYTNFDYNRSITSVNSTTGNINHNKNFVAGSAYLQLSESPYSGFVYYNVSHGTVKYTFTDSITGEKIYLDDNSFMTFNSLNGYNSPNFDKTYGKLNALVGEFFNYDNYDTWKSDSEKDVFLVENSDIMVKDRAAMLKENTNLAGVTAAFMGYSNEFEDKLGSPTFTNNSVSFQVEGVTQEFTFGSANRHSAWQAPSTAVLFDVTAPDPDLLVMSSGDCVLNDGVVPVGEPFSYQLDQEIHVIGQDILEKYDTIYMQVYLPDGVRYISTEVLDDKGNVIDPKFIAQNTYNKTEHRAHVRFDPSFLKGTFDSSGKQTGGMLYQGETYTMRVNVEIDSIKNVNPKNITATGKAMVNKTMKAPEPAKARVVEDK